MVQTCNNIMCYCVEVASEHTIIKAVYTFWQENCQLVSWLVGDLQVIHYVGCCVIAGHPLSTVTI